MKKYNVFTDFHHAGLLHSLILLFEGRLGGKVYRPIGIEWANQGFWDVYPHPATQAQFLTLDQGYRPVDGTPPLNQFVTTVPEPEAEVYYCQDIDSGYYNKAITVDTFFKKPIDIVIASIPQHIEPFKRLCMLHPNQPRLVFQIGNSWTIEAGMAPNIMASAIIHGVPDDINFISYHQEFDTNLFAYDKPSPSKHIYSFVNMFDLAGHYANDWQLFTQIEKAMPEWTFRAFGGQCRDGAMHGAKEVAKAIKTARFVWHTKYGGDGYGHIIHNVPACGRPLIVKKEYYRDKMAEPLLDDGITCIAIDGLNNDQIVQKVLYYNETERYEAMCKNAYFYFRKVVDFKTEAEKIGEFIQKLK